MDQDRFEQHFRRIIARLNQWHDRGAPPAAPHPATVRADHPPRDAMGPRQTDETRRGR